MKLILPSLPAVLPISQSPIDSRRGLYRNIVLSGGTTMFKDFGRRLQRDIKRIVDTRMALNQKRLGHLAHTTQVRPSLELYPCISLHIPLACPPPHCVYKTHVT